MNTKCKIITFILANQYFVVTSWQRIGFFSFMGKIIIYQALVRHFSLKKGVDKPYGTIEENGCGGFRSFSNKALKEIKKLGCTHIWFTGVIEHASQTAYPDIGIFGDSPDIVKGIAGSPYAVRDYYNVSPDLAIDPKLRMKEFEDMVYRTHQQNLRVVIDFVPNHVARCYKSISKPSGESDFGETDNKNSSFSNQNNFYYFPNEKFNPQFPLITYEEYPAKATGNDCFTPSPSKNDWYETAKLNYGIDYLNNGNRHFDPLPDTWIKMRNILIFWASKGIDGFRCDMAEMVPVEFWHWAIGEVKRQYPHLIFIAEIYNPTQYRPYIDYGGFDYLYDKVGLYDTLRDVVQNGKPAKYISNCWHSVGDIQGKMLNFLENHDEQRIASDFFASDPQRAIPALIVSTMMNTNPFLLYAGQELGEKGMDNSGFSEIDGRSSIFDYYQPDTIRRWVDGGNYSLRQLSEDEKKLRIKYKKILTICHTQRAISEGLFYDLTYANIENPDFNSERCFAFLRKYQEELLLIVANFAEAPQNLKIVIPHHAFDFWGITPSLGSKVKAKELLTEKELKISFAPDIPTELTVEANTGMVLRIIF